jgi:DNA-binding transcriptional MerR regulator
MMRSSVLTLALVLFSVAYAPTLFAETDAEQSPPADQAAPAEPSTPSYSDQELHSFAVAMLEVERIKSNYAPKLAENLRQQAQVKQAAALELMLALKQQGMSLDKYQEMLANVQADPQLADKVSEYLKSEAKNGKGPAPDQDQSAAEPNSRGDSTASQKVEEL